jgi:hypothetical protein
VCKHRLKITYSLGLDHELKDPLRVGETHHDSTSLVWQEVVNDEVTQALRSPADVSTRENRRH